MNYNELQHAKFKLVDNEMLKQVLKNNNTETIDDIFEHELFSIVEGDSVLIGTIDYTLNESSFDFSTNLNVYYEIKLGE